MKRSIRELDMGTVQDLLRYLVEEAAMKHRKAEAETLCLLHYRYGGPDLTGLSCDEILERLKLLMIEDEQEIYDAPGSGPETSKLTLIPSVDFGEDTGIVQEWCLIAQGLQVMMQIAKEAISPKLRDDAEEEAEQWLRVAKAFRMRLWSDPAGE